MPTPEEKLNEVQQRFNQNVAQAQQIEQQIAKLQEDQGAIKALKELVTVEQTA